MNTLNLAHTTQKLAIMAFHVHDHGYCWDVAEDQNEEGMEGKKLLEKGVPDHNADRELKEFLN